MVAHRVSRNISLTPELDGFVDSCLESGDYGNASEVVRTALKLLRGQAPKPSPQLPQRGWPIGGGECGALIREKDWSATPLGPVEHWPGALRATVANMVNTPVATVVVWGPDYLLLYNDGYRPILGDTHPAGMGMPGAQVLPDLWEPHKPSLERARKGEVVSRTDLSVVLDRKSVV